MTIILIILLILAIIYLAYQNRKLPAANPRRGDTSLIFDSEQEDLIADKDAAIRAKNEAEQESLFLSNKLKNKQQEVSRKDQEIRRITELLNNSENKIQRLKKEKSQAEIALNKTITELRQKHRKQGKLLDEEQCENNKLTEKITQLEAKIRELEEDND